MLQIIEWSEKDIIDNWSKGLSIDTLTYEYVWYAKHKKGKYVKISDARLQISTIIYNFQMRGWQYPISQTSILD